MTMGVDQMLEPAAAQYQPVADAPSPVPVAEQVPTAEVPEATPEQRKVMPSRDTFLSLNEFQAGDTLNYYTEVYLWDSNGDFVDDAFYYVVQYEYDVANFSQLTTEFSLQRFDNFTTSWNEVTTSSQTWPIAGYGFTNASFEYNPLEEGEYRVLVSIFTDGLEYDSFMEDLGYFPGQDFWINYDINFEQIDVSADGINDTLVMYVAFEYDFPNVKDVYFDFFAELVDEYGNPIEYAGSDYTMLTLQGVGFEFIELIVSVPEVGYYLTHGFFSLDGFSVQEQGLVYVEQASPSAASWTANFFAIDTDNDTYFETLLTELYIDYDLPYGEFLYVSLNIFRVTNGYWNHRDNLYYETFLEGTGSIYIPLEWQAMVTGDYVVTFDLYIPNIYQDYGESDLVYLTTDLDAISEYYSDVYLYIGESNIGVEYWYNYTSTIETYAEVYIDLIFIDEFGNWQFIDSKYLYIYVFGSNIEGYYFEFTAPQAGDYMIIVNQYSPDLALDYYELGPFYLGKSNDYVFFNTSQFSFDGDNDGADESVAVNAYVEYNVTSDVYFDYFVEFQYYNAEYGYWQQVDYTFNDFFLQGAGYYIDYFEFQAPLDGEYRVVTNAYASNGFNFYEVSPSYFLVGSGDFVNWNGFSYTDDSNYDGLDDTMKIIYDGQASVSEFTEFYFVANIYHIDPNTGEWVYVDFPDNERWYFLDAGYYQYLYLEFSIPAFMDGDYVVMVDLYTNGEYQYTDQFEFYGLTQLAEYFNLYSYWNLEDRDGDGYPDTFMYDIFFEYFIFNFYETVLIVDLYYYDENTNETNLVNTAETPFYVDGGVNTQGWSLTHTVEMSGEYFIEARIFDPFGQEQRTDANLGYLQVPSNDFFFGYVGAYPSDLNNNGIFDSIDTYGFFEAYFVNEVEISFMVNVWYLENDNWTIVDTYYESYWLQGASASPFNGKPYQDFWLQLFVDNPGTYFVEATMESPVNSYYMNTGIIEYVEVLSNEFYPYFYTYTLDKDFNGLDDAVTVEGTFDFTTIGAGELILLFEFYRLDENTTKLIDSEIRRWIFQDSIINANFYIDPITFFAVSEGEYVITVTATFAGEVFGEAEVGHHYLYQPQDYFDYNVDVLPIDLDGDGGQDLAALIISYEFQQSHLALLEFAGTVMYDPNGLTEIIHSEDELRTLLNAGEDQYWLFITADRIGEYLLEIEIFLNEESVGFISEFFYLDDVFKNNDIVWGPTLIAEPLDRDGDGETDSVEYKSHFQYDTVGEIVFEERYEIYWQNDTGGFEYVETYSQVLTLDGNGTFWVYTNIQAPKAGVYEIIRTRLIDGVVQSESTFYAVFSAAYDPQRQIDTWVSEQFALNFDGQGGDDLAVAKLNFVGYQDSLVEVAIHVDAYNLQTGEFEGSYENVVTYLFEGFDYSWNYIIWNALNDGDYLLNYTVFFNGEIGYTGVVEFYGLTARVFDQPLDRLASLVSFPDTNGDDLYDSFIRTIPLGYDTTETIMASVFVEVLLLHDDGTNETVYTFYLDQEVTGYGQFVATYTYFAEQEGRYLFVEHYLADGIEVDSFSYQQYLYDSGKTNELSFEQKLELLEQIIYDLDVNKGRRNAMLKLLDLVGEAHEKENGKAFDALLKVLLKMIECNGGDIGDLSF